MDLKRKIAMAAGTLAIALACGQFVQNGFGSGPRVAGLPADPQPRAIVPLAGDATAEISPPVEAPAVPRLPDQALMPAPQADTPATIPLPAEDVVLQDACAIQFDLTAQPDAMLGLTMLAPCQPGERVVLRHAGLAFTGKTSATGGLFLMLPALKSPAEVSVLFADGTSVEGRVTLPDMATTRRFAVQWMADDAFQLNAFENTADYGQPGHVSVATPQRPAAGAPARSGFLTELGDAAVELPLLAQVYTFPAVADVPVRVSIDAAVTAATCERDLLGETLVSLGGRTTVSELTLAMPPCDAIGDYLVLNNLLPDMNIATAN